MDPNAKDDERKATAFVENSILEINEKEHDEIPSALAKGTNRAYRQQPRTGVVGLRMGHGCAYD